MDFGRQMCSDAIQDISKHHTRNVFRTVYPLHSQILQVCQVQEILLVSYNNEYIYMEIYLVYLTADANVMLLLQDV